MRKLTIALLAACPPAVLSAATLPAPAAGATAPVALPLAQAWSDRALITRDDDWSSVPGVVGHRGDGLVSAPGSDPRTVVADGSATPVDVNANRPDPRDVTLPAGVTEFELENPVVALQGSATAGAPHLLLSLDTRRRAGVSVRLALRDIDSTAANATQPVAVQYRVGASGSFATAPGGYVADATSGPSEARLSTPVTAALPAAADDKPLVQVRVLVTNADGHDEWVGVDDIEVTAARSSGGDGGCAESGPPPEPPGTDPDPAPPAGPRPKPMPRPRPDRDPPPLVIEELALTPSAFAPAARGRAISRASRRRAPAEVRRGAGGVLGWARAGARADGARADGVRAGGARLRFRLSRPALVRFAVRAARAGRAGRRLRGRGGQARFTARGRRGLNRLRFSGRIRGRPLAPGAYTLRAVAVDRAKRESAPATVSFRITGAG